MQGQQIKVGDLIFQTVSISRQREKGVPLALRVTGVEGFGEGATVIGDVERQGDSPYPAGLRGFIGIAMMFDGHEGEGQT